jgi:hypothetical protein
MMLMMEVVLEGNGEWGDVGLYLDLVASVCGLDGWRRVIWKEGSIEDGSISSPRFRTSGSISFLRGFHFMAVDLHAFFFNYDPPLSYTQAGMW